jgi:O-antigen/teichoic acid export membrane protein
MAPVLIHRLGADQWGLLLLVWSVAGLLSITNFGLGEATLRYVARYVAEDDITGVNRVLGATLTFYVVVSLIAGAAVWIAAPTLAQWVKVPTDRDYPLETLLRLTILLFAGGMISNAFRAVPMALNRYDISAGIGSIQGIVRSAGLIALAVAGLGVVGLVIWELIVTLIGLTAYALTARRIVPALRCWPSMSLSGIRETIGYSVYSFMTHIGLMIYRESGRLILGNRLGTESVAYFGTPDSISQRLHLVLINAIETLVPRFSGRLAPDDTETLLVASTWTAFLCVGAVYVPLAVLMPDFLRLWISSEFSKESGLAGQLLALGLIGSVTFAPIATLFRGKGQPGFVSAVMAATAVVVLTGGLILVPLAGVVGAALAYFIGNITWFGGLCIGWVRLLPQGAVRVLARIAALPLFLAVVLGLAEFWILAMVGQVAWIGLLVLGATFFAAGVLLIVGVDYCLGGKSVARMIVGRMLSEGRFARVLAHLKRGRA